MGSGRRGVRGKLSMCSVLREIASAMKNRNNHGTAENLHKIIANIEVAIFRWIVLLFWTELAQIEIGNLFLHKFRYFLVLYHFILIFFSFIPCVFAEYALKYETHWSDWTKKIRM